MNYLVQFFYPKDFSSPLDGKRVRIVVGFCIMMVLMMGVASVISYLTRSSSGLYTLLLICAAFFASPLLVLKASSSIHKTSVFFICVIFGNITALNFLSGGFDFRILIWTLLYSQLTFFLLGKKAGLLASGYTVFILGVAFFIRKSEAEFVDYLHLPTSNSLEDDFISFGLLAISSFFLSFHFDNVQLKVLKELEAERSIIERTKNEAEIAKKSLEFKGGFLAKMSHEIRTPLNGIVGIFDLFEGDNLTKSQKDYLQIMKSSGDDLMKIVNNVLDISRLESGKVEMNKSSFSVEKLTYKAILLVSAKAKAKNISLISDIPQFKHEFVGDEARITQILNNLLSNAIKFTNEGIVKLSVKEIDAGIEFIVSDTGTGIPAKKINVLFEKYEQLDTNIVKRKDGTNSGTGLGLPICGELARLMDGEIKVKSEVGKGSFFSLLVPLSKGSEISISFKPEVRDSSTSYDLDVLLVDDKLVNRTVGRLLLEKLGCRVDLAEDGVEAFNKVIKKNYDLVLMDIQMPRMNGVEATKEIKETIKNPPLVIGLSANNMLGDKEKYILAGLDDYLTKPIKIDALESVFQQYFSKKS